MSGVHRVSGFQQRTCLFSMTFVIWACSAELKFEKSIVTENTNHDKRNATSSFKFKVVFDSEASQSSSHVSFFYFRKLSLTQLIISIPCSAALSLIVQKSRWGHYVQYSDHLVIYV